MEKEMENIIKFIKGLSHYNDDKDDKIDINSNERIVVVNFTIYAYEFEKLFKVVKENNKEIGFSAGKYGSWLLIF